MVEKCCSQCLGHKGQTVVDYDLDAQGKSANKLNNSNLLHSITLGSHLNFPVYGKRDQTEYSVYGFVPIVDSPGIAMIAMKDGADQTGQAISESIFNNWPLFAITALLVYIAGALTWLLVSSRGKLLKHCIKTQRYPQR